MSSISPQLSLPLLQPSQAQKHVTHNEALVMLDHLVQLTLEAVDALAAPDAPAPGSVYALGAAPVGAWEGHGGQLAAFIAGGWVFHLPRDGWRAYDRSAGRLLVFSQAAWRALAPAEIETDNLDGLGIGTAHDPVNRLAVASDASLLSHAGADHRLKINKAAPQDTASLLFQSGFSGRAEIGLAGEEALSVKVSADGASWTTALRVAPEDGTLSAPALEAARFGGAGVQGNPSDVAPGKLMRADYGYCPGNLLAPVAMDGAQVSGGVIERGETAAGTFVRFADGTLICHADAAIDVSSAQLQDFPFPADFSADPAVSASHLSAAPHVAIELPNIRILAGRAAVQSWSVRLGDTGAPTAPGGPQETLRLTAIGRWR
ncbi:hypothetical protein PMES_02982 [Profundibacterium mesophilum KAUST100406-0324]|uniref:DUF2793 domain-containing protein n=2 Tax=Profundibacterium TaxID=1258570 RepID=A0A921NPG4_9RHOB|nr:hypothetical protein PMES_02982 [Profundibacterium mesophilum KAUST100406-0324]